MWKVSAFAEETAGVYVYRVDMPQDSKPTDVAAEAYGTHGKKYREGRVQEWLGPLYTAQWESN